MKKTKIAAFALAGLLAFSAAAEIQSPLNISISAASSEGKTTVINGLTYYYKEVKDGIAVIECYDANKQWSANITDLKLASKIDGKPVVELSGNVAVFRRIPKIYNLYLPEGLKRIKTCLVGSSGTNLYLPSTITELSDDFFLDYTTENPDKPKGTAPAGIKIYLPGYEDPSKGWQYQFGIHSLGTYGNWDKEACVAEAKEETERIRNKLKEIQNNKSKESTTSTVSKDMKGYYYDTLNRFNSEDRKFYDLYKKYAQNSKSSTVKISGESYKLDGFKYGIVTYYGKAEKTMTLPTTLTYDRCRDTLKDKMPSSVKKKLKNEKVKIIGADEIIFDKVTENVIVPEGYLAIGGLRSAYIRNIRLPKSLIYIYDLAFYDSSKLEKINIPSKVKYIGNRAFEDCTSLKSITLPSSLKELGSCAFEGCTSLKSIKLPNAPIKIGTYAFKGIGITSITIPEKLDFMSAQGKYLQGAFANCPNLTTVTLNGFVNPSMFEGSPVKKVVLTSKVSSLYGSLSSDEKSWYRDSFSWYKELEEVVLPETYKTFESGLFQDCKKLKKVTLSSKATEISNNMFSDCESLKTIALPKNIKKIDYEAFSGCTSLTSVTLPKGLKTIGSGAFYGCKNLTKITIPDSVTHIAGWRKPGDPGWVDNTGAFAGCPKVQVTYKGKTYTQKNMDKLYKLLS